MSDEIRKENGSVPSGEGEGGKGESARREEARPKDDELYTPQGGGGGTGSGPIRDIPAVVGSPKTGPKEDVREDVLRNGKITLPQVADGLAENEGEGAASGGPGGAPPGPGDEDEVSSFRLVMTLAVAGAVAGALLVFVFLWSQPIILAENARVLREAVLEVLKAPAHFESVFVLEGELVSAAQMPPDVDTLNLDRVFLGYDEGGDPIGYALEAEGFGFQDIISVIFGYDAETDQVLGMKVLRHLETPGLGDKIVKDSAFVAEFNRVDVPIVGVKTDRSTGAPDQVDMITGATISSKAVIEIINERIAAMGDLLDAYEPMGGLPAQPDTGEPPAADSVGDGSGGTSNPPGNGGVQEDSE